MAQEARRENMDEGNVSIVGRNLEITAPMREHILLKFQKLEGLTPQVIDATVYLEIQRSEHRAEILYKFSHFSVTVHAVKDDMYQAIDLAVARLRRKLVKWKTKIHSHQGKKLSEFEMDIRVLDRQKEELNDINDQIDEENLHEVESELAPPKVVRTEKRVVPTLTMDEAAMRMDLTDEAFMPYKCEEDQKIKVMYLRSDRTIGVLEIE